MRVTLFLVAILAALGIAAFTVTAKRDTAESGAVLAVQRGKPVAPPIAESAQGTEINALPAGGPAQPQRLAVDQVPACDKPDTMGLARVAEIDTAGGPAFGFEHFKQYDFLHEHEVVLTFDDGPWPGNTPAVLKALTDQCVKATFFEIGEHAVWHPEISKMVAAAGMTIGSHTWSHKDLARNPYASDIEQAKQEIEMGVSAVRAAVDGPTAPFFRFPDLQQPPALLAYLAERNIATFSTDLDSFDFKMRHPEQVVESVTEKLADVLGSGQSRYSFAQILCNPKATPNGKITCPLVRQLHATVYPLSAVKLATVEGLSHVL